jgi:CRISPR-associated protein Cas5h
MSFKSFLIFDVSGEYGHFRKFNTTTSPLTYGIPTPTALIGVLGAVLGVEREDSKGRIKKGQESLRQVFSSEWTAVGIKVLKPVKRVNIGFNLLDTGAPQTFFNVTNRTQIEYELLKDPCYRIYLWWEHPRKGELIERLENKAFHFSPYLGLSQFTADISWIGEMEGQAIIQNAHLPFQSVINLSELDQANTPINFHQMKNASIQVETLPIEMENTRIVKRYGEILTENNGDAIFCLPNTQSYSIQGEGNIQLL